MHIFLAALYLAAPILAAVTRAHEIVVHETATVPQGWQLVGDADESAYLELSIALTQPWLGELKKRLAETSNPDHANFGAHLGRIQLQKYQRTDHQSTSAVLAWLRQAGVHETYLDTAWIRFNATIQSINSLLNCELMEYETPRAARVYRATDYGLPSDLVQHIQFIYPVTQFIETSPRAQPPHHEDVVEVTRRQASIPQVCSSYVTPDCLVALYNITYTAPDSLSGSTLGIGGFLEEYPNQGLLQTFLGKYSPERNASGYSAEYNFTVASVNGGNDTNTGSGGEAILDTFYSMAFTQPLPVTYLSTGGRGLYIGPDGTDQSNATSNGYEPWLEFLEYLLALDDETLPKVLSLSYTDDEQGTPRAYAIKVCDLFMQLAARGVSVLAASGDNGASGIEGDCIVNAGPNKGQSRFLAGFPASCPYVTSVGATGQYIPWEPTSWSSGGFSEYFETPEWQLTDTANYITGLNGTHDGWYNTSGRGFPDVTLIGVRYVLDGTFTAKGTSASTPVWASMITLINDARLRAGKPVLGFLNPLLYSEKVRAALWDISSGNIGGCYRGSDGHVEVGWSATQGWDPASGLGTPNFGALLEVLG
ncbi:tripeptidyl-peptidase sed4 [Truncatella angustata]|uniref:tripeptidyl-peptidase II n=1 Tax=Truncatella angustata TaxID=152316 RepID=A0A9P8UU37_9PEZI|nr:tripeptidyl-peptidase sed4 [Truncatella angustata]KAH6658201.1 tripeptidyl-peptidase sed4 [Truncatella angustata]